MFPESLAVVNSYGERILNTFSHFPMFTGTMAAVEDPLERPRALSRPIFKALAAGLTVDIPGPIPTCLALSDYAVGRNDSMIAVRGPQHAPASMTPPDFVRAVFSAACDAELFADHLGQLPDLVPLVVLHRAKENPALVLVAALANHTGEPFLMILKRTHAKGMSDAVASCSRRTADFIWDGAAAKSTLPGTFSTPFDVPGLSQPASFVIRSQHARVVRLLLAACGLETLVPAARGHHVRDDAPLRFPMALGLPDGAGAGLGRMSRGGGVEGRNARATSVLMADSTSRDPQFVALPEESSLHRMAARFVQAPGGASALRVEVDKLLRQAAGDQLNAAQPFPIYRPTSRCVRLATESELLSAAEREGARPARDVPLPILPCSLFTLDGGGPLVRSHVLYHARAVPGRVNLQLAACPD
jgi:hypothetical protein